MNIYTGMTKGRQAVWMRILHRMFTNGKAGCLSSHVRGGRSLSHRREARKVPEARQIQSYLPVVPPALSVSRIITPPAYASGWRTAAALRLGHTATARRTYRRMVSSGIRSSWVSARPPEVARMAFPRLWYFARKSAFIHAVGSTFSHA